jgi:Methyltransferase domain
VKHTLKRLVGPDWQFRTHRLGRLRWLTKYRLMRCFDTDIALRRKLEYVFLDPEIESFSFELGNEPDVIAHMASALGCPEAELTAYAAETRNDPELGPLLAHHLRRRFDVKHRPPLGNRLAWYLIARALKPKLIVETGIYQGLGSLTLLRALEHNRREGHPGELMSFDAVASAGSMVREQARQGWVRHIGFTSDLLAHTLQGRQVDILFQDTPHTDENQRMEFGAALANAAPTLLLLDASSGASPTLKAISQERGGSYHLVPLHSREHIYPGGPVSFAIFTNDTTTDAP